MTYSPQAIQQMRTGFKILNRFMLLMWRLGLGRDINALPRWVGRIMVIAHKGRKSGIRRLTPVNYMVLDGEIYCMAGLGSIADWYRNILADPNVEVWLPDSWWDGIAEEVNEPENRLSYVRQLCIASGFAAPLFGINPRTISDAELAAVTADYRLLRIRRTAPRTGPGGPGDLAWVWPYATFFLLGVLLFRRKN